MILRKKSFLAVLVCFVVVLASGCKKSSQSNYLVYVNVSGLEGTGLIVQLNAYEQLPIFSNGTNQFQQLMQTGDQYSVTVLKQPGAPAQTCTVANADGTVAGGPVTNVNVACAPVALAYLVNSGTSQVVPLIINESTGALSDPVQVNPTGNQPVQFALSPSGRFAYSANYAGNSVSGFLANPTVGVLASVGNDVSTGTGTGPDAIVVDNTNQFVYVANSLTDNVAGFAINQTTAALTCLGNSAVPPCTPTANTGSAPSSLTVSGTTISNEFLFVANKSSNNISEFKIGSLGALQALGTAPTGNGPSVVMAAPSVANFPFSAFVYVLNETDATIAVYQNNAGSLAPIGTALSTGGTSPVALALSASANGNFAYVVNNGSSLITAFSISSAGALTNIGTYSTGLGLNPVAVSVDPSGAFVYVVNQSGSVVTYSVTSTGTLETPSTLSIGNAPVQLLTAARQ